MSEERKQSVVKFVLNTGKVVYLREPTIEDDEVASQKAGVKSGDNKLHAGVLIQKEYVKLLLAGTQSEDSEECPVKKYSLSEKEDLNSIFSRKEYSQVRTAAMHLIGDDEMGNENLTPSGVVSI